MKHKNRITLQRSLKPLTGWIAGAHLLAAGIASAGVPEDMISISDVSVTEGNSGTVNLVFTVTRSANTAAFTVNWATANGTASQPGDYTAANGTLTFSAGGDLSQTVTVQAKGETAAEADETLFVNLSALTVTTGTASITDAQGTGTIQNDDANQTPTVATPIPDRTAVAGTAFSYAFPATTFADADGHTLVYSATLADGSPLPAWLTFTPATRAFSGTPALADMGVITVKVTATDSWTPSASVSDEFTLTVGRAVTVTATSVTEGNSGTVNMVFTVTRTITDTEFTVSYAASGTAASGTDYVALPAGTLTFTAGGALSQTVTVTVNGDTTIEANETIILTLSGVVNTTGFTVPGGTGAATATITNDDFVPSRFPASGAISASVKGFIDLDAPPLTGGAEIPAFDPASRRAFTSSNSGVQVISLANPAAPAHVTTIAPATLGVAGLTSNDVSSVAVRKAAGANPAVLAAAIISSPKTNPGYVIFLDPATGALLGSAQVGANPDHIAFTPDGTKLLVALEAETAGNVDLDTTAGGVAILDLSGGLAPPQVTTAGFAAYDAQAAALTAAGVRLFPGGTPSTDLEPEYFAISADGTKALVTLQEANSVAVLDIATATFTSIKPLGKKDFSLGAHDFSDRDGAGGVNLANPTTGQPVFGLYMPDAIASYSAGGQTYYVTANEGDDRNDFITPVETTTVGATNYDLDDTLFPNEAALKNQASLGRLTVSNVPGIRGDTDNDGDIDEILSYGGRSFSILDSAGNIVFDSGDMLENIMASQFLSNNDDGRSDNKGPEPEGVTIATFGGRTYAFLSLERSHMVAVFDVTDPGAVTFTGGLRRSGDLNPEGSVFVQPADSPTGEALLLVASEASQTLTVFELKPNASGIGPWRQHYFGSSAGAGNEANTADYDNDGVSNLLEFAFGTNPTTSVTGPPELIYTGSFAGNGALSLAGQPITRFESIPNSVDFRYVFVRRKDHAASGLSYTPEFSADMSAWTPSTAVPTVLADDGTHQVVSVPYPRFIAGRKARFARLQVSMP